MNYYQILGVQADAIPTEIEAAFRVRILRLTSQQHATPDWEFRMVRLYQALRVLSSPRSRNRYTASLPRTLTPIEATSQDVLVRNDESLFRFDPLERWISIFQMGWRYFSLLPVGLKMKKVIITVLMRSLLAIIGALLGISLVSLITNLVFGGPKYFPNSGIWPGSFESYVSQIFLSTLRYPVLILSIFFMAFGDRILAYWFRFPKR